MNTEKTVNDVIELIPELFEIACQDYNKFMSSDSAYAEKMRLEYQQSQKFEVGQKYLKLIANNSVFGFICITHNDKQFKFGDLLKAANYKTPAKNFARGNIFKPKSYAKLRWTGIG